MTELEMINASFELWLSAEGEDNRAELDRVKRIIPMILEECCTVNQMQYIKLYFIEKMTLKEIGEMCGVNVSTVSKTIHRGLDKAYPYLKFCSPLFIKTPKKRSYLRNGR